MIGLRPFVATCLVLMMSENVTPNESMPKTTVTPGPQVNAPAGAVRGTTEGSVRVFKGIPFAQPPVGPLRWKPPVPLARWQGVRDATEFGAA